MLLSVIALIGYLQWIGIDKLISSYNNRFRYLKQAKSSDSCNQNHDFRTKILLQDPLMMQIDDFLAPGEAEHIINISTPLLIESPLFNKTDIGYDFRTSSTAFLQRKHDKVIHCIEQRISRVTSMPILNIEGLQVVRYNKNQQYKHHHDYFNSEDPRMEADLKRGGQRVITLFVYLNELLPEDGGATDFPTLNLRMVPKKNSAVYWYDTTADGVQDPRTLHAGTPVLTDKTKWGLNVWIRAGEFH